jgi:hypothetical protein
MMRYISWDWFLYVLVGFVLGGAVVYLWSYLKEKALKLVWYEWVLFILSGLGFIFLCQTFIGSYQEAEVRAAWMSVAFMGIPVLIMMVGALRSLTARLPKA